MSIVWTVVLSHCSIARDAHVETNCSQSLLQSVYSVCVL